MSKEKRQKFIGWVGTRAVIAGGHFAIMGKRRQPHTVAAGFSLRHQRFFS